MSLRETYLNVAYCHDLVSWHGSGGLSQTCHRGELGSIPGHSTWDLWTKFHWDRFIS